MHNIKISFIIICWQEQEYLEVLLESLLQMPKDHPIEFIVGADEDTYQNIHPRLGNISNLVLCRAQNRNRSRFRNQLVAESSGEYLLFLDSAVQIKTDKLTKVINALIESQATLMQFSIIPTGRRDHFFTRYKLRSANTEHEDNFNPLLREDRKIALDTAALAIKREYFFRKGQFNPLLNRYEDREFLLRTLNDNEVFHVLRKPFFFKKYDRKTISKLLLETIEDYWTRLNTVRKFYPAHSKSYICSQWKAWCLEMKSVINEKDSHLRIFLFCLHIFYLPILIHYTPIYLFNGLVYRHKEELAHKKILIWPNESKIKKEFF